MCDRVFYEDLFILKYCPDRYKTQKMSDEAVDDCLSTLQFVSDWFITSKMLKKLDDALIANDDMSFFDKNFGNVTFLANKMGILCVDLDKIYLDDVSFDKVDTETIIHIRLLA